jgi:hypothetical protein
MSSDDPVPHVTPARTAGGLPLLAFLSSLLAIAGLVGGAGGSPSLAVVGLFGVTGLVGAFFAANGRDRPGAMSGVLKGALAAVGCALPLLLLLAALLSLLRPWPFG